MAAHDDGPVQVGPRRHRRRPERWRAAVGVLLVGLVAVGLSGHGVRAGASATVTSTPTNGYTAREVGFLDILGQINAGFLERDSGRDLYRLGRAACGDFGRGDTETQVLGLEDRYVARRRGIQLRDDQIGELVPVAVEKLCPAYLANIPTSVD